MLGSLRIAARTVAPIVAGMPMFRASAINASTIGIRSLSMTQPKWSSLPDHIVIEMPALSPTMEQGTLVSWAVAVGDEVEAGDQLGEIETDKATMSFDSSEDGIVAKLLVEEGAADIPLGTPVIVLCEDAADVAAFADYQPASSSAPVAAAQEPEPAPVSAASPAKTAEPTNNQASAAPTFEVSGELSAYGSMRLQAARNALKAKYPNGIPNF